MNKLVIVMITMLAMASAAYRPVVLWHGNDSRENEFQF
jgi:hypothetical protein